MLQSASVLVDILRAFLLADQSMRRIFARYRGDVLSFDEVQRLFPGRELERARNGAGSTYRGTLVASCLSDSLSS